MTKTDRRIKRHPYLIPVIDLLLSLAVTSVAWGQEAPRLEIEVSSSGEVRVFARAVTYGNVLRALQDKLGIPIEIPAQVDELKLEYARIEATQPEEALKKLLEGSRMGYAWLARAHRFEKVVILAPTDPQANINTISAPVPTLHSLQAYPVKAVDTTSFLMDAETKQDSGSLRVPPQQVWPLTEGGVGRVIESGFAEPSSSTMPLSEAMNVLGAPSGVSPAEVGKTVTFSMSDATRIIGVPAGVSPADVGKTTTIPLATEPGKHP